MRYHAETANLVFVSPISPLQFSSSRQWTRKCTKCEVQHAKESVERGSKTTETREMRTKTLLPSTLARSLRSPSSSSTSRTSPTSRSTPTSSRSTSSPRTTPSTPTSRSRTISIFSIVVLFTPPSRSRSKSKLGVPTSSSQPLPTSSRSFRFVHLLFLGCWRSCQSIFQSDIEIFCRSEGISILSLCTIHPISNQYASKQG